MFTAALLTIAKKVKATQVFIDEWIKQNVAYSYNGTLFSLKKKKNPVTCYNMNES